MNTNLLRQFAMLTLAALLLLSACGPRAAEQEGTSGSGNGSSHIEQPAAETPSEPFNGEYPVVTIEMEDGGIIEIELYPDIAPNTVHNFISLVQQGFYDGVGFHRVVPGFMIQGGDPTGTGGGGPGYAIAGEFKANGFENDLIHTRGVISMARTNDPNSAGSQFFIMVTDSPHLDGAYASFGKVVSGLDVADAIVSVPARGQLAVDPPKMSKVTVDTKGNSFPEPKKIQ